MSEAAHLVWEMSRTFLADQDGAVAVLKVFMDETGTHDGAPMVAVGAVIADARVWREWTKDWDRAKKPAKVYHATDCANLRGEWEGWSAVHRDEYVKALLPVIAKHQLRGVVVGIDMPAYEKAMAAHPHLKGMFGTPYSGCFQWAVQSIIGDAINSNRKQRVAFVHEENAYKGEALEAFDWVRRNKARSEAMVSFSFGSKADYVPLQAADIVAYEGAKAVRNKNAGRPLRRPWAAIFPNMQDIRGFCYDASNMHFLVETLTGLWQETQEGRPALLAG